MMGDAIIVCRRWTSLRESATDGEIIMSLPHQP
jgi:hypothetical protein